MKKILALIFIFALTLTLLPMQGITKVKALENNNEIVSSYQANTLIVNAPTVVTEIETEEELEAVKQSSAKPSNIIVSFDENANVVDKNGEVISDFVTLHKSELGSQVLFMVRIESEESANAFIEMITKNYSVLDIAIISTKPELISKVKSASGCSHVRGAVEYKGRTDLYRVVKTTQENQAIVAVIPQSMATITNVRYIQARLKTVWVRVTDDSGILLNECINSGAYGIVTSDYAKAYDVLREYKKGYTRTPFNIAHRGLPNEYNENSVSGLRAAIEKGATHVEFDGYLTKDKQIVMMHDNTLDRTTNGSGTVESRTLAEIQEFKLDLYGEEEIPCFDDIVSTLKESDVVLVFEIKSSNKEIVSVLQEKIYEHQIQKQIVVISFNLQILAEMKEVLPEIPTANLNTANEQTFPEVLKWMGAYNTTVNTGSGNTSVFFNEALRDHGIIGWYWTFGVFGEGTFNGYVGQTNNHADFAEELPMYAKDLAEGSKSAQSLAVGDKLEVIFVNYSGKEYVLECTVEQCVEYDDRYEVICYKEMPIGLYTQTLTVQKVVENSGGCNSSINASLQFASLALLMVATVVCKNKQKAR
ncbi:MAG: hypothetical protein IJA15_07065 [Clostridia bacterium]|nr:hypothetical protein [Clostridia bacterium]